jgi:hypothetical protein
MFDREMLIELDDRFDYGDPRSRDFDQGRNWRSLLISANNDRPSAFDKSTFNRIKSGRTD